MLKKEALIEEKNLHANIGEHIGYELGAKMVKDYYDKYQEAGSQFVGRNIIDQILAQPGCIGIKIFKALNEAGEKTYVLTGVSQDGQPMFDVTAVNQNGEIKKQEGIVADRNGGAGWFDDVILG
jgi:DhnA family fructose-bisphosphate aldolase class Ia